MQKISLIGTGAVLCLVGAGPSSASELAGGGDVLTEVVVTATRRVEPLQKVPASVAVIDAEAIEKSGSLVFGDLGFQVANFVTSTVGNNPLIGTATIRGITGRAGVYVDDVIVGTTSAYNTSLLDVERVEVIRGPQGTTFGANTLAGAINTIIRRPSLDASDREISVTAGEYGTLDVRGYVTGPVADGLGLKLSGFLRKADGPDRDAAGNRYNGDDEVGFRASALYQKGEDLSILVAYDHSRLDLEDAFVPQLYSAPVGSFADSLIGAGRLPAYRTPTERRVFGTTDPNLLRREVDGISARVELDVSGVQLTSITAYREANSLIHKDEDYIPSYFAFSDNPQDQKQVTQEVRAVGTAGRVSYIGGLYYSNNQTSDRSTIPLSGEYLNLVGLTPGLFSGFLGLPASYSTGGAIFQATRDERKAESFAAFGSATVQVSEVLKLTLGGRYTTENVSGSSGTAPSNLPAFALAFLPPFVYGTQTPPANIPMKAFPDIRSSRLDPAGSISYAVAPSVNLYAAAGTGYRSPGYNSLGNCVADTVDAPCVVRRETGTNVEAGIKSEWFDQRLRLNLVAYRLKLKDAQLSQTIPQVNGPFLSRVVNSDETSKGVELEFTGKPVRGLTVEGSLGYQDASYDDYPNAYIQFDRGGVAPAYCYAKNIDRNGGYCIGDATGQTLPFAPKYTGGVAVTYERSLGSKLDWFVRTEGQHRGAYGVQLGTAAVTRVSATSIVNVSAGISQRGGKGFALVVRGRNVTDEHYFTNAANVPTGETYVYLNSPSTWSVELSSRF